MLQKYIQKIFGTLPRVFVRLKGRADERKTGRISSDGDQRRVQRQSLGNFRRFALDQTCFDIFARRLGVIGQLGKKRFRFETF